jgi:hypothetical protein
LKVEGHAEEKGGKNGGAENGGVECRINTYYPAEKTHRARATMSQDGHDLQSLGDILGKATDTTLAKVHRLKPKSAPGQLTRVQARLLDAQANDAHEHDELCFQHTVFCQTGLPYRDPGDDVREWQRTQGAVSLLIKAGEAQNPHTKEWVKVGLPWGTKPRLILAHLNAEALRQDSPLIEIESSLTAFVKRIRGFQQGREIRMFKHQLAALSTAVIRLAMSHGDHTKQVNTQVISAFDLWLEKDERQRVLWPSTIQLSLDYFVSLRDHAVPLPEADLAALAHSALALDLFAWLAQRLHRVHARTPAFIPWAALKEQFGQDYGRMNNFKAFFRRTLKQVMVRYPKARVDLDNRGLYAYNSPPPVAPQRRLSVLAKRHS